MNVFKRISANTPDQELINKYLQSGNLDFVAELYKRYVHLIFSVALKYLKVKEDAEDISIKIFEVLSEKLPSKEIENVGGWIHVVTKNECLMQLRSATKAKQKEIDFASFMELDEDKHYIGELDLESNLSKLESCLNQLKKEQKRCIELFYKQQKCYREVANLTGFDLKKVKSYLQNGKRNLILCMQDKNG